MRLAVLEQELLTNEQTGMYARDDDDDDDDERSMREWVCHVE